MSKTTKVSKRLIRRIKRGVEKIMIENPTFTRSGIAEAFGVSRTALWKACHEDPELRQIINGAEKARHEMKIAPAVENKFIQRLLNGDASETGYIFYLSNHIPDRYKDRRAIVNNNQVSVNNKVDIDNTYQDDVEQQQEFIESYRRELAL